LRKISTIESANVFLEQEYLPAINTKFAQLPQAPEDANAPVLKSLDLADIFCVESRRAVSNDFVVQFEKRLFQIREGSLPRPRPGDKVTNRKWLDNSIHIYWKNKTLLVQEINISAK
jgi:hypothetical protein